MIFIGPKHYNKARKKKESISEYFLGPLEVFSAHLFIVSNTLDCKVYWSIYCLFNVLNYFGFSEDTYYGLYSKP